MPLKLFKPKVAVAMGVGLLIAGMPLSPASANDVTLDSVRRSCSDGPNNVCARATWDDSNDTLCVKAYAGRATAKFQRPNGAMVVISDSFGGGQACTGNLSIREDYRTQLKLDWYYGSTYEGTSSVWFYT